MKKIFMLTILVMLFTEGCGLYLVNKECNAVEGYGCYRTIWGYWDINSDPDFRSGGPRKECIAVDGVIIC